ncbi:MerR family transcriptional regulator [Pseudonocardia spinosispora]|uniref:MerR family transcriptional regulator n=1 Tax=Pseudonocardia spinosispora TaxID=103441 RepID=UPI00040BE0C1|nr:MerR family transcriptional regulator [Pseudonocardia spinosispora]
MNDGLVGIGEAARRFGLAESTLRYWEERGLIAPAQRRGNWRRYGPGELHRIGLIQMWREAGTMSLDEIALVLAGDDGERTWRAVVQERIDAITLQQQRLEAARQHLEHLLTCPDEHPADDCPYLREATTAGRPWAMVN